MSLSISNSQSFTEIEKEGIDFINYVSEKSNAPFTFSKQHDFETMIDLLEKHLKTKSKFDANMQLLLYKVLKTKKLLKKLRESLSDIEKNISDTNAETIMKAVFGNISFEELEDLREKKLPKGDFYNYNGIRNVLKRKLNGEITDAFFKSWLIFLCNILNDEKFDFISNYFDVCSFLDGYNTKRF